MGNPSITQPQPEQTPCWLCKHFERWGETSGGSRYIDCDYWKRPMWGPKDGCRWWVPELKAEDERGLEMG